MDIYIIRTFDIDIRTVIIKHWTDWICHFRLPFSVAWWSHWLQEYLIFAWTDWICLFRLCCSLVVTSIITLGLPTASLYILIIHPTPNHLVTILSSVLAVQSLVLQNRHLVNVNLAEYWRECRLFLYRNSSCVFFFLKGRRLKRTW